MRNKQTKMFTTFDTRNIHKLDFNLLSILVTLACKNVDLSYCFNQNEIRPKTLACFLIKITVNTIKYYNRFQSTS